jgi:ketosteroid isomerase-like protein
LSLDILLNHDLINKFYNSFATGDPEGMVNCYSDDIHFSDPAFGDLFGKDAKNMWRMLLKNSKGSLKISFNDVHANEKNGSAKWTANYTFSKTKRPVVNKITSSFEFRDGKIIRHYDQFNLWKWSRQALGLPGYLLGWSAFMKNKINMQAKAALAKYNASE